MSEKETGGSPTERPVSSFEPEAYAYTDGASIGSRGPGGYGVVVSWDGKTEEVSGGEQDTTNQRMEVTAACVALETIDESHVVTIYSDSSYLVNCMRRGWHQTWRKNGWLNNLGEPVANRDLWERLLKAVRRHKEVWWKKVKGHQKSGGPHKAGNDRADELAVLAKKDAGSDRRSGSTPPWRTGGPRIAGKRARRMPRCSVLDGGYQLTKILTKTARLPTAISDTRAIGGCECFPLRGGQ